MECYFLQNNIFVIFKYLFDQIENFIILFKYSQFEDISLDVVFRLKLSDFI